MNRKAGVEVSTASTYSAPRLQRPRPVIVRRSVGENDRDCAFLGPLSR